MVQDRDNLRERVTALETQLKAKDTELASATRLHRQQLKVMKEETGSKQLVDKEDEIEALREQIRSLQAFYRFRPQR